MLCYQILPDTGQPHITAFHYISRYLSPKRAMVFPDPHRMFIYSACTEKNTRNIQQITEETTVLCRSTHREIRTAEQTWSSTYPFLIPRYILPATATKTQISSGHCRNEEKNTSSHPQHLPESTHSCFPFCCKTPMRR